MNEVTKTAPVSTPVSVIKEPGHSLGHVYNQNTSVRHNGSSYSLSKSTVALTTRQATRNPWLTLEEQFIFFTTLCIRETVVTQKVLVECCIILGVKLRVMCIEVCHQCGNTMHLNPAEAGKVVLYLVLPCFGGCSDLYPTQSQQHSSGSRFRSAFRVAHEYPRMCWHPTHS